MPTDADHPNASNPDRHQWRHHSLILIACSASFMLRWWINNYRLKDRVCEEGMRRFQEFLVAADSVGLIDHERLDELTGDGHNARP